MPFIDHQHGKAYYRHWAAAEPRAAVIFLHGFGEHTGVYHRYGFTLNAAGIDLWAVDQFGHGLSPGTRGDFGSIEDSSALADSLIELAGRERPGLPLIAQGHSFGSVVTMFRLLDQPDRYRAGVISGADSGARTATLGSPNRTGAGLLKSFNATRPPPKISRSALLIARGWPTHPLRGRTSTAWDSPMAGRPSA